MKKITIGVNIDGVLRDYIDQFDKHYRKVFIYNPNLVAMNEENMAYRDFTETEEQDKQDSIRKKEEELLTLPVDSFDLLNHYKFEPKSIEIEGAETIHKTAQQVLEDFMYEEFPFQIFGKASEFPSAVESLNRIQSIGNRRNLFDVILFSVTKNHTKVIPSTLAFLASHHCRVGNYKMNLQTEEEKWEHCDICVDIMPQVFQSKPEGKKTIKINNSFNKYDNTDYDFNSLKEMANEETLIGILEGRNLLENFMNL